MSMESGKVVEVVEDAHFYRVVYCGDPDDWIVEFNKEWADALSWATNIESIRNKMKLNPVKYMD